MKTFKDFVNEATTTHVPNAKKGVIYKVTSNGKPEPLKAKNKKELESYLGYALSNGDWRVLSKSGHLRVAPTVELLMNEGKEDMMLKLADMVSAEEMNFIVDIVNGRRLKDKAPKGVNTKSLMSKGLLDYNAKTGWSAKGNQLSFLKEDNMKTYNEFMTEARYTIKDGYAEITKANYGKVHKDFKGKLGKDKAILAMNPKNGKTEMFPVKFISESIEQLDENYKQYLPKVPHDNASAISLFNEMTDDNDHTGARWMLASYVKDKKLVQAYEAIMVLHEYFKDANDIYTARGRLDKALQYIVKQKFNKDELQQLNF